MTAAREQSINKARKVFALGVSTTYVGEKEKCFQQLSKILQQQNMVLFDLDTQLPKRLDLAVLRVKMGLESAASGQAGSASRGSQATAGTQPGTAKGSSRQQTKTEESGPRFTSQDPEVMLWTQLSPTERRRLLDGSVFGSSLWPTVRNTTAYTRLLTVLRDHDLSPAGCICGDTFIIELLEKTLQRSGSAVSCAFRAQTVFDDLAAFCLSRYKKAADEWQAEQAKQRRRREEEQAKQRQRKEEEARAQAAAQREKEVQASKRREEHARQKAEYQRWHQATSAARDPETVVFQTFAADKRRSLLDGPMFSQGVLHAIDSTSAFTRLLAELSKLDIAALNLAAGDGHMALMGWVATVLTKQGSGVTVRSGSGTIFDDLVAHCQKVYEDTAQPTSKESTHKETMFVRSFDDVHEARLYLKVTRSTLGASSCVRSYSKGGQLHIEMYTTSQGRGAAEIAFRTVLRDLQVAAMNVRFEAARVRDKAIQEAHAHCDQQSARAFKNAVDAYLS